MRDNNYLLLLNDTLKSHIISLHSQEKKRLREKFDFLANGIWDAGVRIKKLKGLSKKVIFEARLTRSRRILFTLGKYNKKTVIYVWGIVDHDDISDKARNILPDNAPFLSFEPEILEDHPDLYIDDLKEHYFSQESIEERADDDCGPQKWLVLSNEEWNRLLLKGDPENFEIFLLLTSEQRAILENRPPILLSGTAGSGKTTISVYYLLRKEFIRKRRLFLTYSPFLKRFSERIYSGLVKNTDLEYSFTGISDSGIPESARKELTSQENGSTGVDSASGPDFFTFRELLQKIFESFGQFSGNSTGLVEFEDIFRNHKLYKKYDTELVWEEIRSIIKGAKPAISLRRYKKLIIDYLKLELKQTDLLELKDYLLGLRRFEFIQKIERIVERKTRFAAYEDFMLSLEAGPVPAGRGREETAFVLQEILKVIEKRADRFSTPLLTLNEYNSLGKKRAPNFIYDREDIYSIAEYYQEKLEDRGFEDEIDLCRKALGVLESSNKRHKYDLVVCDEVQDFSDIQLSLILRLADPFSHILFAGDTKQIINPSGFRWEEVKAKFYERGVSVPEVFNLNLNFRCVGSIVKMSNALLDLKQQLVGLSGSELREDWKFNGKPPFLIQNISEKDILKRIRLTSAGRIILVRSEREQNRLKKTLHTELVFTIYQAKGLEFDTVLIWKFCKGKKTADIWRRIKNGHAFDRSHYPHLKHELSLLYVAITRSRNTLVIYDGETSSDIWDLEVLYNCLFRTEDEEVLSDMWEQTSSPGEWEKQGDYFFEKEYYPAAVECYRNAGNMSSLEKAEAFILAEKKQFEKAAVLFEKHRNLTQAAENFEKARNYDQALRLWNRLDNKERSRTCRIKLYEKEENYNRAAEEWEKLNNIEKALENWIKAENYPKIANHYYSLKQYKKASKYFELARNYGQAAVCFKKIKMPDRAADLFFRAKDYKKAAPIYKKLKDNKKLLKCYSQLGDYYAAGTFWEKEKSIHKAIENYRRFGELSQANRELLNKEAQKYDGGRSVLKAGIRYSALSLFEKSAPIYFKLRLYDRALTEFQKTGNAAKAAECYSNLGKHYEAVLELEKTELPDKWNIITRELTEYLGTGRRYDRNLANRLFNEAERMLKEESLDSALARYKAINYEEGIYETFLKLKRDNKALEYLLDNSMEEFAGKYVEERGDDLTISLGLLEYLTKANNRYAEWYMDNPMEADIIIRLCLIRLQKHREETKPIVERFLSSVRFFYTFEERIPDSLLDLIIYAKSYNTIFRMAEALSFRISAGGLAEKSRMFFERLKETGEVEGDNNLLAGYYYLFDREKYEEILSRLTLTGQNFELFSESRAHYRKAVDYILAKERPTKKNIEMAATICRINDDYAGAGLVYERSGILKSAGKYYKEGGKYEDAIRCYREIGDEANVARVYERMIDFQKAIEIWENLGRMTDVSRVKKKLIKLEQIKKTAQLDLF